MRNRTVSVDHLPGLIVSVRLSKPLRLRVWLALRLMWCAAWLISTDSRLIVEDEDA